MPKGSKRSKDISGQKFGRLTAVSLAPKTGKAAKWHCMCECGNASVVAGAALRNGTIRSCGCLHADTMAATVIDLTGLAFGRLTVVNRVQNRGRFVFWRCRCQCGQERDVASRSLVRGITKSCGCLSRELRGADRRHPLWAVWSKMVARCHRETTAGFENYGARGITVCDRWRGRHGFKHFVADIGDRPTPQHCLERRDNNAGYSPENCCWATRVEQARNKRNNRLLTHNGVTECVAHWSVVTGIPSATIISRMNRGLASDDVLGQKVTLRS